MGIETVEDMLMYFPRTYEVHNESSVLSDLRGDMINTITAKIIEITSTLSQRSRKWMYKALLEDSQGNPFEAIWFHKPYQLANLKNGTMRVFIGKIKLDYGKITIQSPKIEHPTQHFEAKKLIPVYSATEQISSSWLMKKMAEIIEIAKTFYETLPVDLIRDEGLISKVQAIQIIHFPDNEDVLQQARERLAFEELFKLQLSALKRKEDFQSHSKKYDISIKFDTDLIKELFESLPFIPTNAQKISIFEILKDMEKEIPMSRLLEWDVWSGKTLVAAAAALVAVKAWFQVAIMSPTEVLTKQHFISFKNMLSKLISKYLDNESFSEACNIFWEQEKTISLLLWSQKKKEKDAVLEWLKNGDVKIVIWTHAIIQDSVEFLKLWLCIIDEQHRFWVEQRKKISKNGSPHLLMMTATPIPRTLAIVAYGDQDLSVLNEMPKWRQTIITKCVSHAERITINRFIDDQIDKWRQSYVICPLIEESDSEIMSDVKSVTEEYERLKEIFPNRRLAFLHGKMKSEEKDSIFQKFKSWETDILISTSVIEVGVDVPNSTIMLIEWSERFWLSQLHQFRGRVGRWEHQSYCFLFTSNDKTDNARLNAMEKYSDWFQLAEIDMRLRGPGEVYGIRQSGIPDLKMAQLTDQKFVFRVRKAAEKFISTHNS